MKNRKLLLGLLMVIIVLAFFGCVKTPKLLMPTNPQISTDGLITWDAVDNATGYRITIGDSSYTVIDTQFQAPDVTRDFTYTIVAVAKGCEDSDPATGSFVATEKPILKIPANATLVARSASATINDDEFDNYDFTKLFILSTDTQVYAIEPEWLDLAHVSKTDGGYVTCTVEGRSAKIDIEIHVRIYHLSKSVASVTVYVDEALNHDYNQYFRATRDGVAEMLKSSMATSTVKNVEGQYSYSVNYHGITQSIVVNVMDRVVITASRPSVTINDYDLEDYDFASLFAMTVNGVRTKVTSDLIDASKVSATRGGDVVCSKNDATATISVIITRNVYTVTTSAQEITIHTSLVADYDYMRFFEVTHNGKVVDKSIATVTNNVKATSGDYEFTVTVRDVSDTMTVHVTDVHQVQVVLNYPNLELSVNNVDTFDYTRLFALYVDEKAVQVAPDMVDATEMVGATVGSTHTVTFNYFDADDRLTTKTATVNVVDKTSVTIVGRDVVTYPNATPVDLTSLFAVTDGVVNVPVTNAMLSGSVDYSKAGSNVITCSYGGETAQATVTIQRGVVINVRSDEITVRVGTNKETYFFEDDFELIVNGVKMPNIIPFLDVSEVDFAHAGEYTATLSVGYFDGQCYETATQQPTADLQYITAQITYKVVEKIALVSVVSDSLTVNIGSSFKPLSNLIATINDAKQTFVTDKNAVNAVCCYVEIVETVDTSALGAQPVTIKVYVNGPDAEPQVVKYGVTVISTAKLTSRDKIVFVGDTLYTTDLFTITDENGNVPVTADMVSGDANTFKAGLYTVNLYYMGANATARVVVLEQSVRGVYYTYATTIATEAEEDEEGWTTVEAESSRGYGPMTFDNNSIVVDGRVTTVKQIIDEHTFIVSVENTVFTMHMFDGIVVLDPDNSLKMGFSNTKRPLVYFNSSVWTIDNNKGKLIVNYGEQHVLAHDYSGGYTIEVYTVTSKADTNTQLKIALYVQLVTKMNSDTIYRVSWGDVALNDDFVPQGGTTGLLMYDNVTYSFTMRNSVVGKVNRTGASSPLYTGTFKIKNGNDTLRINSDGSITYTTSKETLSVSKNEIAQMKNGGIDYVNNTILVYSIDATVNGNWYCYKFNLNREDKTFTLVQKDSLFGLYKYGNCYVFLDGYGGGLVSYNTSSYNTLQLTYDYNPDNREVTITHINSYGYPQYGSGATFYLLNTLNVLVVKSAYDASLAGKEFFNVHISDGAIVRFGNVNLCEVSRQDVLNYITIETKDGVLTKDQMKNKVVSYDSVDRYQSGVYQIVVNVSVGGKTVKCYYAVQTFMPISPEPQLAQTYGSSVLQGDNCALTIDKYGLATVTLNGESYSGNVQYYGNDRFVVRAKTSGNANIVLQGKIFVDGVIYVSCSGAVNFFDYFTKGECALVGNGEFYLRKITVNGVDTYVWANNLTSTGSLAQVEDLSNNQFAITSNGSTVVVLITTWGDAKTGMQVADNVRGEYLGAEDATLKLDGFGTAAINGATGTYTINANGSVTVITASDVAVFTLNKTDATFEKLNIAIDKTLVAGKTFNASHTFICEDYPYLATTNFAFAANGSVTITSASAEHDSGDDQCASDSYKPPFIEGKSQVGTYSVTGNKVTVTISNTNGNFTFVFEIVDLTVADRIVCVATNVGSDVHGYFKTGTTFVGFTIV